MSFACDKMWNKPYVSVKTALTVSVTDCESAETVGRDTREERLLLNFLVCSQIKPALCAASGPGGPLVELSAGPSLPHTP